MDHTNDSNARENKLQTKKWFTSIGSGCVNDINKAADAAKEAFIIYSNRN